MDPKPGAKPGAKPLRDPEKTWDNADSYTWLALVSQDSRRAREHSDI